MNQTEPVVVHKGRTNTLPVSLGVDVSGDTFTSQIRTHESTTSSLIATWTVSFLTDGTDGELILKLDNSVTSLIVQKTGFMDIKRVSLGEPIPVFDAPLPVLFREAVTA